MGADTSDKEPIDPGFDASGHRARLRTRLIEEGPEALHEVELLEYLLMLAIPRRDTKPTARRLIDEFGSLGAVLTADAPALLRFGLSEGAIGAIKIAQASALRLIKGEIANRPVLGSWQALTDYLHATMAHRMTESVRVIHLNSKNMLIRDEAAWEGSIDQSAIYIREVAKRALEIGSAALIIVHNHPSGDPAPSKQDIALTRELIAALKPLGIQLHDHLIVGTSGQASLRSLGLL